MYRRRVNTRDLHNIITTVRMYNERKNGLQGLYARTENEKK